MNPQQCGFFNEQSYTDWSIIGWSQGGHAMMNSKYFTKKSAWLAIVGSLALGAVTVALHAVPTADAQAAARNADSAITVTVRTVALQKIRVWSEFSGRTQAVDFAEIRPEVSGRITQVRFKDGQAVKAGEILFVIDPRPYEAAVAKAEAALASANANAEFAG